MKRNIRGFPIWLRIGHQGVVDNVLILDNGVEVFAELAASKPPWLHASSWNRLRLVGRGENVRACRRFTQACGTPTS